MSLESTIAPAPKLAADLINLRLQEAAGAAKLGTSTANPIKLNDGHTTLLALTEGAVFYNSTYGTVVASLAIYNKWQNLASAMTAQGQSVQDYLGAPVGDVFSLAGGGEAQYYERGMIVLGKDGKPFVVFGAIYLHYRELGGVTGFLGLPLSDEQSAANGGRCSLFANGDIYWTGSTGARAVQGLIRQRWLAIGGAGGRMGYPTSDETAVLANGREVGRFNSFQNGGGIYWTAATGAWEVYGSIAAFWKDHHGGPTGRLGFPTSGETDTPNAHNPGSPDANGRYNNFQRGIIVWHPAGPFAGQPAGTPFAIIGLEFFLDHFESDWGKFHVQVHVDCENPALKYENWIPSEKDYASNPSVEKTVLTVPLVSHATVINVWMDALGSHQTTELGFTVKAGADERLGIFQGRYDLTNLWGLFDNNTVHPANQDVDHNHHFNAIFRVKPVVLLPTGVPFRQQLYWPFKNFTTDELTFADMAQTFSDVDEDASWLDHPFNRVFFETVYKGMAKGGTCFGMCLEALYAKVDRSVFPEPIFNSPFINYPPALVNGGDPTDARFTTPINIKHGYQYGASNIDYFLGKFVSGQTHDPVQVFEQSHASFQAGDPPVLCMTPGSFSFGSGHVVLPYRWDNSKTPWTIQVANPNVPWSAQHDDNAPECVIAVDPAHNTFSFHLATGSTAWSGGSSSGGRLYMIPFSVLSSEPRTPFWEVLAMLAAGTLIVLGDDGETTQVTDGAGRTFYQDATAPAGSREMVAEANQRIPNMALLPQNSAPIALQPAEIYYLTRLPAFRRPGGTPIPDALQDTQLTWEVKSRSGAPYSWAVRSAAGAAVAVVPGAGPSDKMRIDNLARPGQAVTLSAGTGGAPKAASLTLIGPTAGGPAQARRFELTGLPLGAGSGITVQLDNAGRELVVQNPGPAATIGLRIQSGTNAANSVMRPVAAVPAGAVIKISPGDWTAENIARSPVTLQHLDKVGGNILNETQI